MSSDEDVFITQNTFRKNLLDETFDSIAAFDAANVIENLGDTTLDNLLEGDINPSTVVDEKGSAKTSLFSDISDDELVQTCSVVEKQIAEHFDVQQSPTGRPTNTAGAQIRYAFYCLNI